MSFHKSRIDAIKAILAGSKAFASNPARHAPLSELEEVKSLVHIGALRRRHLLAVLHSTRALDSVLSAFVAHYGLSTSPSKSLGNSFICIEKAPLGTFATPFTMRVRFQASIVRVRNRYMHEAGAFPTNDYEIRVLLGEMEHCLSIIVALE